MGRLASGALFLAIALGSSPGEGKPRQRSLGKKQCFLTCARIMECAGMPRESSTVAETAICADDCVFESRDEDRRAGWLCAARAEGCEALKACGAGAKSPSP